VFIKRTINDMGVSERLCKSEMSMNIDPEMLPQTVAEGSSRIRGYVFHRIGNAKCLPDDLVAHATTNSRNARHGHGHKRQQNIETTLGRIKTRLLRC
jgi:hypothetical protein